MDDIQIQRWLANEGELIQAGEGLIEVETQKASTEVTAPQTGYLRKKLVAEGDVPPDVDQVLNKPPGLRELGEALARYSPPVNQRRRRPGEKLLVKVRAGALPAG